MCSKIIIDFEGNIGAGKTTLLEYFEKNKIYNADILYEPVNEWKSIKDDANSNIFEKFNYDKKKYAFEFQHIVYYSRMNKLFDLINNSDKKFIFMDRSLGTDKNVFEQMLYDNKYIDELEHKIYNYWDDFIKNQFHINKNIIYLKCDPETAYNRMLNRGRKEEININISYIEQLHNYHNKWINQEISNNKHVLVLDCNDSTINESNIEKINKFINECHV